MLWAGVHRAVDADTLTALYAALHPTSAIAAGLFVLGHAIGSIILRVALWRSRCIPRGGWPGGAGLFSGQRQVETGVGW